MKPMFPSVAAYSSLTLMSPKRFRNSDQMSVRTPLPMAILTLWSFSLSFCKEWHRLRFNTEACEASYPLLEPKVGQDSFYLGRVAEVAHCFANILHHCHIILPAVAPELRGRELSPQKNGHTCNWHRTTPRLSYCTLEVRASTSQGSKPGVQRASFFKTFLVTSKITGLLPLSMAPAIPMRKPALW